MAVITNNSAVASSAAITTTETYITPTAWATTTAPAAGDTYVITLGGTINSTAGTPTFNLRMGANNSLSDPILASVTPFITNTGLPQPFKLTFNTTVRVAGTSFSDTSTITGFTITGITQAAQAVITCSGSTNPFVVGQSVYVASVTGMTQMNTLTSTVVAAGGTSGAWTGTVNVNSTGFTAYASGGTLTTSNIVLGNTIAPTATATASSTVTVTNASFYVGGTVVFATTAGNMIAGTTYYVLSLISTTGITISATPGGSAITNTVTTTLGAATSGVFGVGAVVTLGTAVAPITSTGTNSYVVSFVPSTLTIQVAATPGGTPIVFTAAGTPTVISQLVLNGTAGAAQVVGVIDGNLRSIHSVTDVVVPTIGVTTNGSVTGFGVSVVTTAATNTVIVNYANITKAA